jgi:hypothetical protein
MCDNNKEYFAVRKYIKKLKGIEEPDVALLIMTQPLDKTFEIGEDVNLGIVKNVKRFMDTMQANLQKKNSEES